MKTAHTFSYDPTKKRFYFDDNGDYQWAKATITSLSIWHNLDDTPIGPFKLFYSDEKCSLVLQGLSTEDASRIISLFELNKIRKVDLEENSKSNPTNGSYMSGLFFSRKKTSTISDHKKIRAYRSKILKVN